MSYYGEDKESTEFQAVSGWNLFQIEEFSHNVSEKGAKYFCIEKAVVINDDSDFYGRYLTYESLPFMYEFIGKRGKSKGKVIQVDAKINNIFNFFITLGIDYLKFNVVNMTKEAAKEKALSILESKIDELESDMVGKVFWGYTKIVNKPVQKKNNEGEYVDTEEMREESELIDWASSQKGMPSYDPLKFEEEKKVTKKTKKEEFKSKPTTPDEDPF